jgi:hypothetical protein
MSNRLLKEKIPYIDDNNSIEDVVNYMTKVLNKTYINRKEDKVEQVAPVSEEVASVLVSGSFTALSGSPGMKSASLTLSHGLGRIPNGFYVVDHSQSYPGSAYGEQAAIFSVRRTAWTASDITVYYTHINYNVALTVYFTLLIY